MSPVSFGFIITRHVNSETTNHYWNECVRCIRKLYPWVRIVIIDDNSQQEWVKEEQVWQNVEIIQSEYPGRGELLPFIYFLKRAFFKRAVMIHDSVFFHKKIPFHLLTVPVMPLWHFNAKIDTDLECHQNNLRIVQYLKPPHPFFLKQRLEEVSFSKQWVIPLQKNQEWVGCFGVQCVIQHSFLVHLEKKYGITGLISVVKTRPDRCSLERIMGLLFCMESLQMSPQKSLFGNIKNYMPWGYTFNQYKELQKDKKVIRPIVKVWTGR